MELLTESAGVKRADAGWSDRVGSRSLGPLIPEGKCIPQPVSSSLPYSNSNLAAYYQVELVVHDQVARYLVMLNDRAITDSLV